MAMRSGTLHDGLAETDAYARAVRVLQDAEFFKAKEAEQSGLISQLAHHASFVHESAGQVLFRQDDPGTNCYVVIKGAVGVYIYSADEDISRPPRAPTPRSKFPTYRYKKFTDYKLLEDQLMKSARSFGTTTDDTGSQAGQSAVQSVDSSPYRTRPTTPPMLERPERFVTTEGFSTFNEDSALGRRVKVLGRGSLFGEIALSRDLTRAATIRCSRDCELLVVTKAVFKKVMAEMISKLRFFNDHVPGLKTLEYRLVHPSTHFKKFFFPPGHAFMHEGMVSVDQAVYLIYKGSVELRRFRRASDNRAYLLAVRPLDAPEGMQAAAALMRSTAGSDSAAPDAGPEAVVETIGEGFMFSPLCFFPISGGEPFSVVAGQDGCEVFYMFGSATQQMPLKVVKAVRQQLLLELNRRLRLLGLDELLPEALETGSMMLNSTMSSITLQGSVVLN